MVKASFDGALAGASQDKTEAPRITSGVSEEGVGTHSVRGRPPFEAPKDPPAGPSPATNDGSVP